jgi:diaminohydroxyphosphoribosylaminopyrimidine deaminase/5-amino-6-(5-phosphoribosylamino)uracil reductase
MNAPDDRWMRRALEIAERGRGHVEPNPLVGAVLVCDGEVVGEGWHRRYGEAHAEVDAIRAAGDRARGATLYVTLEPCCHQGKTPPCTDAVIRAEIARVYAALEDPFPQVAGQGAAILEGAGVPIEFGMGATEARRQNAPYLTLLRLGRPYVHGKWAMTLDGKIATKYGDSKWISSEASREIVHQLRGRMDGILVGFNTAMIDDPLLTARPPGPRTPCRVVLDLRARLPIQNQLFQTARETPTLLFAGPEAGDERIDELRKNGVEVDVGFHDRIENVLHRLGLRRWTNLLVEGGAGVLTALFEENALDEVHVFVAPKIVGGGPWGRSPIVGRGVDKIADALVFPNIEIRAVGVDAYIHGWRDP